MLGVHYGEKLGVIKDQASRISSSLDPLAWLSGSNFIAGTLRSKITGYQLSPHSRVTLEDQESAASRSAFCFTHSLKTGECWEGDLPRFPLYALFHKRCILRKYSTEFSNPTPTIQKKPICVNSLN